jgi:hypothetical protein
VPDTAAFPLIPESWAQILKNKKVHFTLRKNAAASNCAQGKLFDSKAAEHRAFKRILFIKKYFTENCSIVSYEEMDCLFSFKVFFDLTSHFPVIFRLNPQL